MLRRASYSDLIFNLLSPKSSANQKLEVGNGDRESDHSSDFREDTDSRNATGLVEA